MIAVYDHGNKYLVPRLEGLLQDDGDGGVKVIVLPCTQLSLTALSTSSLPNIPSSSVLAEARPMILSLLLLLR